MSILEADDGLARILAQKAFVEKSTTVPAADAAAADDKTDADDDAYSRSDRNPHRWIMRSRVDPASLIGDSDSEDADDDAPWRAPASKDGPRRALLNGVFSAVPPGFSKKKWTTFCRLADRATEPAKVNPSDPTLVLVSD